MKQKIILFLLVAVFSVGYFAGIEVKKVSAAEDTTPPMVATFNPLDDATDVAVDANLIITFDETVDANTGNIVIKKSSDDSTVEMISIISVQITGTGTMTITIDLADLDGETGYYIQIDAAAFNDTTGNNYVGISDTTTWNFTTADITAPTVTFDPLNGATGVEANLDITITFDEEVRHINDLEIVNGEGDTNSTTTIGVNDLITLKDNTNDDAIAFDATIDGDKKVITINPTDDFESGQVVYVAIGATVEDASDNAITASSATFTIAEEEDKDDNTDLPEGLTPRLKQPNPNSGITLYKSPESPRVYVIKDNTKHWVKTLEEFNSKGYSWGKVKIVSAEIIGEYSDAEEPTTELLRAVGSHKVYKVENGKKRWIETAGEFNAAGYKWKDIKEVSLETMASYQNAILSDLLRAVGDYKVYKIKDGKKRWIETAKEFNANRYNWKDVEEVSVETLNDYPDSE